MYQWGNTFNNDSSHSHNTSTATTTDSYNRLNAMSDKTQNNSIYGASYDNVHGQRMNGSPTHSNMASPPLVRPGSSNYTQQAKVAKTVAQETKAIHHQNRYSEQNVGIPAPITAYPAQYDSSNEPSWLQAGPSNDSRYQTSPRPSRSSGIASPSPSLSSGNLYTHPETPPPQAYHSQRPNPFRNPSYHPYQGMAPQGQDASDSSMYGDDENEDRAGPVL